MKIREITKKEVADKLGSELVKAANGNGQGVVGEI